jgi:hypothetical protein
VELLVVVIPGVQRFIAESRSTADLYAGSALISEMAASMAAALPDPDMLVIPARAAASASAGMPARVVVLADTGTGPDLARAIAQNVRSRWGGWLEAVFRGSVSGVPETPGFPAVQWVVVPLDADGYRAGWARAQAALAGRKRIRDFPGYQVGQAGVCALTGRWPSLPEAQVPGAVRSHRPGEALSAVGYVKRWYGRRAGEGFPSTWSIASAPYRDAIIRQGDAVAALWDGVAGLYIEFEALCASVGAAGRAALRRGSGALPGIATSDDEALGWLRQAEGAWCAAEAWDPDGLRRDRGLPEKLDEALCESGRKAALSLAGTARAAGIPPLTPYLAVVAQDADHMGEQLSRFPDDGGDPARWHRHVSEVFGRIALRQRAEIESPDHLGRVVYAGGDDLLALVPAERALTAASAINRIYTADDELTAALDRPSASTAVVFFHAHWPLQSAIAAAQALLKDAKKRHRPGLGIAVLNRGGERTRVVLPWLDPAADPARPMIEHITELAAAISGPLSGRLAAGLESDREALAGLGGEWLERELARRAARQGISADQAPAAGRQLAALCGSAPGERGFVDCARSVLIARFLAAQAQAPA